MTDNESKCVECDARVYVYINDVPYCAKHASETGLFETEVRYDYT